MARTNIVTPDNVSSTGTVGLGDGSAQFGNNSRPTGNARDSYGNGKQYNPALNGQEIRAVRRDPDTQGIVAFQLANGSVLSYDEATQAIQAGNHRGLTIQSNQYGPFIKTLPDGDYGNNLDNLPMF